MLAAPVFCLIYSCGPLRAGTSLSPALSPVPSTVAGTREMLREFAMSECLEFLLSNPGAILATTLTPLLRSPWSG